jgi:hypothetical protein
VDPSAAYLLLRKALVVAGLGLFLVLPDLGDRWFSAGWRVLGVVARKRHAAVLLTAGVSLGLSVALTIMWGIPQPYAHDEFSYLLAGDTFAHGRLANPVHPLWKHFETFHVLQVPTYASKYPPGQGLALAAGQVTSGHPIVGVWLSTALACGAACWMLFAWLPPRWALAGGLLTAFHPVVVEWSRSYWGGAVAFTGGALVFGALGRLLSTARGREGVVMGLGLVILANSRPYEGAVLGAAAVGILLWRVIARHSAVIHVWKATLALLVVLSIGGVATGLYYYRVTGHPLQMPYEVHEAAYAVTPLFIWQRPRTEPAYRHAAIRDFHLTVEMTAYRQQQTLEGWLANARSRYADLLALHFPTTLRYLVGVVILLAIPALRRDPRLALIAVALALFFLGTLPEVFMSFRYTAPAASVLFLLALRSFWHVRLWRWRRYPVGRSLVRIAVMSCVAAFILTIVRWEVADPEGLRLRQWAAWRASIIDSLSHRNGKHLVIVRYGGHHSPHQEWVYNEAAIDTARVVWAREMDGSHDCKLLAYFRDRHVWLLPVEDDRERPQLRPYPNESSETCGRHDFR